MLAHDPDAMVEALRLMPDRNPSRPTGQASGATGAVGLLPQYVLDRLATVPPEGERSDAVYNVTCCLFELGYSIDGAIAILSDAPIAEKYRFRGDLAAEVARTHGKWAGKTPAHAKFAERSKPVVNFNIVYDEDIVATAHRELIKGTLPFFGLVLLGGQSGAGKSYIAVSVAVELTRQGGSFFGRPVRERVGVVFVAAEGAGTIENRIAAAKKACGLSEPLPIAVSRSSPDLSDEKTIQALIVELKRIESVFREKHDVRLGAIIIDTLAAACRLDDENDNAEAAEVCRNLRSIGEPFGALVIAVHHFGKSVDTGLRGASAYRAEADAVLAVLADRKEAIGDVSNRKVALAKSRTGIEGVIAPFALRFVALGSDEFGDEFGDCAIEASYVVNASKITGGCARFIQAFEKAASGAGFATERAVRDEYFTTQPSGGADPREAARKGFASALEKLAARYQREIRDGVKCISEI
ncbi:MAG: AAA family ATPase [Hyphomicrobiales bacterium]|nr:AAA family ATPase [Hyphomicrobiales bacterium]